MSQPVDMETDTSASSTSRQRITTKRTASAAQSPLETYLREINETPLLSAEEELELASRIEQGDVEAREPNGSREPTTGGQYLSRLHR